MDDPSEARLLVRARGGDAEAFALLVERYWDRLHRWLYALTRHEQSAEDLTQEAFLRAWRALGSLRAEEGFRVWLFAIARNCLLDGRRGPRGRPTASLPEEVPAARSGPLDEVLQRELGEQLREECDRLPWHYRAALLLWAQERMSYTDVARALSISEETARWRVCKARQLLLARLAGYLDGKVP